MNNLSNTKNLFLCGPRLCGKSTLLKRYLEPCRQLIGGYFVQRLYLAGVCQAFRMVDINRSEEYLLNKITTSIDHEDNVLFEIGERRIMLETFEILGVTTLQKALYNTQKKLIVMDELGRLEEKAPQFKAIVCEALDCPKPVLGVIKDESRPFLDRVRSREDVEVLDWTILPYKVIENKIVDFLGIAGVKC
ncbi:MAG: nucleoside-triphosphatase [Clostridia bacterium]|nr:nucleoside-triphosphatase [Clostridia bacterium]